jgi:benzoate-CoA ligase
MNAPPPAANFNFAAHLFDANRSRSGKAAFVDDAGTLTYGELARRARCFSASLAAAGIRREERVLLLMLDTVDWPIAFLGCLHAGVIPVAVNTLLSVDDYAYMIAHCRAQAAFVSAPLVATLETALARSAHEVRRIVVSRPQDTVPASMIAFEDFVGGREADAAARTGPDDIAFWLYSSGSTGRPKATVHTHANPYWTAELYGKAVLGLVETDVAFSAAKLFFAYGLGNALTFPLSVGATTVLMAERPTPDAVFRQLVERRPTVYFGAPTGYASMLASPNVPSRGDVALRLASSAGEPLPREIAERFTARFGCEIIDGIGSTEMLHIFLSNRPGDVRYGTTGKPVAGYEIALRGDDGRDVADGEIGDLYIDGPSAALLYWGNREKSRETFRGAWTKSGDKYVRDADGYYTYAGRTDDMLKVSGQFVSPFEVETTLVQHDDVLEAAVIGISDTDGLTRPKAFVVLKPGRSASEALGSELQRFVKARLAPHKYPRTIEFIDDLPKTATGKIQRFRLREREANA